MAATNFEIIVYLYKGDVAGEAIYTGFSSASPDAG